MLSNTTTTKISKNMKSSSAATSVQSAVGKKLTSGGLDLEKMRDLLSKSYPKIESARGKDIVLVLGNTGSGKSTTVNYLLGCSMKKKKALGGNTAQPVGKVYATIGNNSESTTFSPEVHTNNSDPILYCDCPGFLENRGKEEKICVSINTQMAINLAKSIKSIMVVVDIKSLTTDRGDSFRKLSDTLALLFKNPVKLGSLISFVFTKTDADDTPEMIVEAIEELIEAEEKKLSEKNSYVGKFFSSEEDVRQSKIEQSEIARKLEILYLIKNNPKNIMIVNVFDKGESKQQITQALQQSSVIPKNAFDFSEYDDTRVKFNEVIFDVAQKGTAILNNKIESPIYIKKCTDQIEDAKERIDFYTGQIKKLQSGEKIKNTQLELNTLNKKMEMNKKLLKELTEEIDTLSEKVVPLRVELKGLDTDELCTYWQDSVYEVRGLISFLGWTLKEFKYEGIPFEEAVKHKKGEGAFYETVSKPKEGHYKTVYKSEYYEDGIASVSIRVKTKDKPDNKKRIADIKESLPEKEKQLKETNNRYLQIITENGTIEALISELTKKDEGNQRSIQKQISTMETAQRQLTEKVISLEKEILSQQKKQELAEKAFEANAKLFDIIFKIHSALEFKSALMDEFARQYSRCQSLQPIANDYQDEAEQETLKSSLTCPISFQPFVDPVVAKCGHMFSHMEILKYLEQNPDNNKTCPCCREPILEKDLVSCKPVGEALDAVSKQNSSKNITLGPENNFSCMKWFYPLLLRNAYLFNHKANLSSSISSHDLPLPNRNVKDLAGLKKEAQWLEKNITDCKYQLKCMEQEYAKMLKQISEKENAAQEQQDESPNELCIIRKTPN